jgi:DNA-binding NarL/FixJ family response regulator
MKDSVIGLTTAQLKLLQACLDHRTTADKPLATALSISPHTVHTQFQRICETVGAHTRTEALLLILRKGLIALRDMPEDTAER